MALDTRTMCVTMDKTAVDNIAQSYWTEYFGDYGRLWVREIPRYIRAAIEGDLRRSAAVGAPKPVTESECKVIPWGYKITADRVELEAQWVGNVRTGRKTVKVSKLILAEFNHDGDLLELATINAPTE